MSKNETTEDTAVEAAAAEETAAVVAAEQPKAPFTVPLKELDVGKAGVSDLFEKINEITRYLNALSQKPKAQ